MAWDRPEWRALVLLLGHLGRAGAGEIEPYALRGARRELDAYDPAPF